MDAVCTDSQRHVRAIVDDQSHAVSCRNGHGGFSVFVKLQRSGSFVAKLNESGAAAAQQMDLICV
jgi:hypothetical protein